MSLFVPQPGVFFHVMQVGPVDPHAFTNRSRNHALQDFFHRYSNKIAALSDSPSCSAQTTAKSTILKFYLNKSDDLLKKTHQYFIHLQFSQAWHISRKRIKQRWITVIDMRIAPADKTGEIGRASCRERV